MAPTTPVSIKKARGLAAQKVKEGIDAEMEGFTSEFQTIEKDLQKHLLGNVKVFFKDMTFKWSDGENRPLADENRSANLRETLRNGVFRTDPMHRMSGILKETIFKSSLRDLVNNKNISIDKLKEYNINAQFPVLDLFHPSSDGRNFIEMQSGQHRMKILQELRKDPLDHWWIVTVYSDGTLIFSINTF